MTARRSLVATLAGILVVASAAGADRGALPLQFVIDVPTRSVSPIYSNATPRMDYESVDAKRRLLYIAYLGADEVLVFSLDTNTVVAHIPDVPRVHGLLVVPELHTVYASATGADQIVAIDEERQEVTARTAGGDYPDGIAYDADDHKIFVSDEHGGTDTVIDTRTNRIVDTIDLDGEVGNTQYDAVAQRIYSDVQTCNEVVAIDPKIDEITARYALPGCDHAHGLLLDVAHRMAFVACDGNAKLLVMDMSTWREIATFSVGDDPDVLAIDQALGRVYVAAESGVVAVFEERGRSLRLLGRAFLAPEAHTVAVDPTTHRVYFALQNVGGRPVIRVMTPSDL